LFFYNHRVSQLFPGSKSLFTKIWARGLIIPPGTPKIPTKTVNDCNLYILFSIYKLTGLIKSIFLFTQCWKISPKVWVPAADLALETPM